MRVLIGGGCAVLVLFQLANAPAIAQEPPPSPGSGHLPGGRAGPEGHPPSLGMGGGEGPQGGGPLSGLAQAEADHAAAETIASLAKVPLGDVMRIIRTWGVPTALRYFAVAPEAFHQAVLPHLGSIVQTAEREKLIEPDEADRLMSRLQHEVPPPPAPE